MLNNRPNDTMLFLYIFVLMAYAKNNTAHDAKELELFGIGGFFLAIDSYLLHK